MEKPYDNFGPIFDRMENDIFKYISKMAYNRDIVEDVMQETFLEVYRNIDMIKDLDIATQRSYIYRIARNCLYKYSTKEYKNVKNQEPYDDKLKLIADDFAVNVIENEFIESILIKLTPSERYLLSKHYLDYVPLVKIAELSNEPVGTVKMRLSRLRKKIRDEFY